MKNKRPLVIALLLTIGITVPGCVKKDIHDSSHPGRGTLEFDVSWGSASTGVTVPSSYTVLLNGNTGESTSSTYEFPGDLAPGQHTAVFYSPADKVSVSTEGVAAIETEDGYVTTTPGWFFASGRNVLITADKHTESTVTINQQTGELVVSVVVNGAFERVSSAYFEIDNIAASLDLTTGGYATPSKIQGELQKKISGDENTLEGSIRLLGVITSATKTITLLVTLQDESQPTTLTQDISSQINDFNSNKVEGVTITNTLTVPYELNGTATIGTWINKTENDIIIDEED